MATLAEIREKLKQQDDRAGGQTLDNAIYPHWNMPEGQTAVIRFLPDGNDSNTFFWVERLVIKLPFTGVKGDPNSKPMTIQVPCMEMYGKDCPVLREVRGWFKDPSLEEMGRKYWKKRSYIFQGFVNENSIADEKEPENPIRRFVMTKSIFDIIKSALLDPELEEMPTDFDKGLDFRISKTNNGQYASYSTSKWARKETSILKSQKEAINTHGLSDLRSFLPDEPDAIRVSIIEQMFNDSVNGEPYDESKYGQYYRPYGMERKDNDATKAPVTPVVTQTSTADPVEPTVSTELPVATETVAPVVEDKKAQTAENILAVIRRKRQET